MTPVWPNLTEIPKILGGDVVRVPLAFGPAGWTLDLDRLLDGADAGHARARRQLAEQSDRLDARRRRTSARFSPTAAGTASGSSPTTSTSGSAYADAGTGPACAPSFLDFAAPDDRVVSTNSFSKSWLMTGFRLGWIVAPPALMADLGKLIEYNTSCSPAFVQRAGIVALRDGEPTIARTLARYRRARDLLLARIERDSRGRGGAARRRDVRVLPRRRRHRQPRVLQAAGARGEARPRARQRVRPRRRRLRALVLRRERGAARRGHRAAARHSSPPDASRPVPRPRMPTASPALVPRVLRLLALLLGGVATVAMGQPVEVFSPQGSVKGVRQASARFATPMVPFGDPRELDPFVIDCPAKGRGRWADMKNWVYDFDSDLPAGVRCSFTLKAGLTALDGTLARRRSPLRIRYRRPGDCAQPALRGEQDRREPGLHPRPRCAGHRRVDRRQRLLRRRRHQRADPGAASSPATSAA